MTALLAIVALAAAARAEAPEDAVRAAVAARLGVPAADVDVADLGPLAGRAAGAPCDAQLPRSGTVEGRVPVVVTCGAGRWSLYARVGVWRSVPVAAQPARAGERISVATARVGSDQLHGEAPVSGEGPWRARVDVEAGAPLTTVRVEAMPDAARGAAVTLVAGDGGLAITAPGELLGDAFVGREVKALNTSTRVVVRGTYRGDGRVTVEGP